jgi:DNA-directed RNA polymerase specialized sigma subunit
MTTSTRLRDREGLELFRRCHDHRDDDAREALVRRHLSLARKIARRYGHTREPFDDLFQVASLGLLGAIRPGSGPGVLVIRGPDDHRRDQTSLP